MKKKLCIWGICISCCSIIYLCTHLFCNNKEKLVVYIPGAQNIFFQDTESRDVYSTPFSIGYYYSRGELGAENGNIIEKAIKEYSLRENLEIEIHYLGDPIEEGKSLLEYSFEHNSMPDLIIASKTETIDYISLCENGLLVDWTEYIEQDEGINDANYYMEVLGGGNINDKQVVMPILFNFNGVITNKSYLVENKIEFSENLTYQEIIEILQKSCISMSKNEEIAGITETSGQMLFGQYIPSILLSSAYSSYFSYVESTWNTNIELGILNEIIETISLYQQQDCAGIMEWKSKNYEDIFQNPQLKSQELYLLDENSALEKNGIFLFGGRDGGQELANSFLTDAIYFANKYREEVWIQGIPAAHANNKYNANVSLCALAPRSTRHTDELYDLIRYLMDYEYGMYYGFSVNRAITQNQLYDAENFGVEFYPNVWGAFEAGQIEQDMLYKYKVQLQPLSSKEISIIYNMLENIAGAGLSSSYIEQYLMTEVNRKLFSEESGESETVKWTMEEIIQYNNNLPYDLPFSYK